MCISPFCLDDDVRIVYMVPKTGVSIHKKDSIVNSTKVGTDALRDQRGKCYPRLLRGLARGRKKVLRIEPFADEKAIHEEHRRSLVRLLCDLHGK
jgi:hypothetical protein